MGQTHICCRSISSYLTLSFETDKSTGGRFVSFAGPFVPPQRPLEQGAGGAARQRGAVAAGRGQGPLAQALAVGGAGPHGQQVVVAGDVAVPGHVVGVLRVAGHQHAVGPLEDADGRLWKRAAWRGRERERERERERDKHHGK